MGTTFFVVLLRGLWKNSGCAKAGKTAAKARKLVAVGRKRQKSRFMIVGTLSKGFEAEHNCRQNIELKNSITRS